MYSKSMTWFIVAVFFGVLRPADAKDLTVDFEFQPPQWRTAICLPDDPYKTLVDEQGTLLYHYRRESGDFSTRVSVVVDERAKTVHQSLVSPRVPIVLTERETPDLKIVEEVFALKKTASKSADARNDVILVHATNKSGAPQTIEPKVLIQSGMKIAFPTSSTIRVNEHETVICTEKVASVTKQKKDNAEEAVMTLAPMTIEPGKTVSFAAVYCGGGHIECTPATLAEAEEERVQSETFWKTVALPYDRVVVPDKNIQALIDSSIRNIWQAREIKNGLPAFQVGPTCYRGLWIVDGAFILEAANLVRRRAKTRAGIDYTLTFQKQDGRFEILPRLLQGKRHRALDVRPPRAAHARQSMAAVDLAEAGEDRRASSSTSPGELQRRLAVERRPAARRRCRRRHQRRRSIRILERVLEPDGPEGDH